MFTLRKLHVKILRTLYELKAIDFSNAVTLRRLIKSLNLWSSIVNEKLEELQQMGLVNIKKTNVGIKFVWFTEKGRQIAELLHKLTHVEEVGRVDK